MRRVRACRRWACDRTARTDGERRTAAAGRLRVRIADDELRTLQAFGVIDLRAHQVLQAQWIDEQRDIVGDDGQVVLALQFVELEPVLEARTSAALDIHAQLERRVGFLGDQFTHLRRRRLAELQRLVQRLVIGRVGVGVGGVIHALRMGRAAVRFNRRCTPVSAAERFLLLPFVQRRGGLGRGCSSRSLE
jgi:hypothetical protein